MENRYLDVKLLFNKDNRTGENPDSGTRSNKDSVRCVVADIRTLDVDKDCSPYSVLGSRCEFCIAIKAREQ